VRAIQPCKTQASGLTVKDRSQILKQLFGLKKQNCLCTSKLFSTFGTIGKATGFKMTVKAVGKNSNFAVA